ncbi:MAG: hypothetical protein H0X11_07555 [Betaproteobacteria bacterium]|nr:hypothetical protein [Betaproteobacteria bacterium]
MLAIGLHQPIVHALFAAPFLLRLLRQRRWPATIIFGGIYLAGCAGWFLWRMHFQSVGPAGVGSIFNPANPKMLIIQPMNILLVIGWASLVTPLLAVLGFRRFFRLSLIVQDAALSCLLTFCFYYFFYLDQAHGWGYRYLHGALGCLMLIAVVGWNDLSETVGAVRAKSFLLLGLACSLLLQLPLRCLQAEAFIRPFARAAALLKAIPAGMVVFDPRDTWYSGDLIRNDPFLENRPLIGTLHAVQPEGVAILQQSSNVQIVDHSVLAKLGLSTERFEDARYDPFRLGRGK